MTDENLVLLLERFREFTIDIEARKKRGQNDFNPLLCVQKLDDEVNMHSGFLYALLNPCGEHYQDDLFLKLFLDSISLKKWFGNTSNAEVYKEYKNIDIYITNNNKHIIIENKIWARDQGTQIERYIETIAKEQSKDSSEMDSNDNVESNELESSENETKQVNKAYENIAVLYLTPDGRKPSKYSLGEWEIQGDSLVNENNKVRFKAITYEKEILSWLDSALNEAGGISNLRMAIECYTDVVKRLIGKKDNTMDLQAFFNKEENKQFLDIALELVARRDEVLKAHFSAIAREIESRYEGHYKIDYGNNYMDIRHNKFYKDKEKFFCIYAWYDKNQQIIYLGVVLYKYDTKQNPAVLKELKSIFGVNDSVFHKDSLKKNYQGRFLLSKTPSYALKDFTQERFINFFESVRKQTDEFNQKIADDLAKGQDSKLAKFLLDNN